MKKSPASIERNANASAKQKAPALANAAEIIFHSKPPATENQKERNAMNAAKKYRITDFMTDLQGDDLDALIDHATAKRWHGKLTIWKWNGSQWKYVRRFEF